MRVTSAVREYVRKAVLAKVADRLEAAEKAKDEAMKECDDKVAAAKALAEKMAERFSREYAAEAAKLGLTWIPDSYDWYGKVSEKNGNKAFLVLVCSDDFAETVSSNNNAFKGVKSKERTQRMGVIDGPKRIREAANDAADKLLFDLELGKVAKQELDEMLKELEVKL